MTYKKLEDIVLKVTYKVNKGVAICLFRLLKSYYESKLVEENELLIKERKTLEQLSHNCYLEEKALKEQTEIYKNSLNKVCQNCGKKMPY